MYDVFISYRRKNGFAVAKMFSGLLKSKGINTFVDLDELRSGTFDDKILTAIEGTPSFVLILTPGSLDRCCDADDWLTKEILTAVDSGRNIIPVLCDGFEWPKKWEIDISDKIKMLSKYNSVSMSYDYIDATVDKIIEYANAKNSTISSQVNESNSTQQPLGDINGFFNKFINKLDEIEGVDFAFHAGSAWLQDMERLEALTTLCNARIKIRVLVNRPEIAESMSKYMRHKLKKYLSFEDAIDSWLTLRNEYPNLEFRISDIPLLRIYYSFSMKNSAESATRIKFYTHGNPRIDKNFLQDFTGEDDFYKLYKSEFEFLWDNATTPENK